MPCREGCNDEVRSQPCRHRLDQRRRSIRGRANADTSKGCCTRILTWTQTRLARGHTSIAGIESKSCSEYCQRFGFMDIDASREHFFATAQRPVLVRLPAGDQGKKGCRGTSVFQDRTGVERETLQATESVTGKTTSGNGGALGDGIEVICFENSGLTHRRRLCGQGSQVKDG